MQIVTTASVRPYRLCIVETHPIQYKAPLFRRLAEHPQIEMTVLYSMIPDARQQGTGFDVPFVWDVPLLGGYRHILLENRAKTPSVTRFNGCDTPEIYERLLHDKPDAVLVNGWVAKTCLQALWACRRLGIPCLVRGEANLLRPRVLWKHVLHRLLLKQYSAFLAIGLANRDFYRFHRCHDERIFFAPYAVDNNYFAVQAIARASRRDEIRAAFGIPRDACVFLFAGKLEEKKHPMDILDAVSSLSLDLRMRSHALIVGGGPLRLVIEQKAREHGLPVTCAGFLNQSKLPDAYVAADVLVLPSDAGETWGLVVNEAMACGLPAIVSDRVGCQKDLVEEGRTGCVFPVGDTASLGRAMAFMVENEGIRKNMGASARERIESYAYDRVVEGILKALACVMNDKSGGRRLP